MNNPADHTSQASNHMADNDIEPPTHIDFDGMLHRYGQNKALWYVAHLDDPATVTYGDWRKDGKHTWMAKGNNQLTPAERKALKERIQQSQRKAQETKEADYKDAASRAAKEYQAAQPASPDHQYLQKKGIRPPDRTRQTADGRLIVPVYDIAGNIQTLQYIDNTGDKLFLKGGKAKGGFFTIGDVLKSDVILICEGMATAASLFEATGYATITAMNAGNLAAVSEALNNQHQTKRILVCADRDDSGVGEQAAQATGYQYVLPDIEQGDFNDMAASIGLEAVKRQIDAALRQNDPIPKPGPAPKNQPESLPHPEPLEAGLGKPAPYPINALPPILRSAAKAIEERVQCATELAAFAVISATCHVAQSRANAQSPVKSCMPCTIYSLSVADSGERKSTAFGLAWQPIEIKDKSDLLHWKQAAAIHAEQGLKLDPQVRLKHQAEAPIQPKSLVRSNASWSRIESYFVTDGLPSLSWISDEAGVLLGGHSLKSDTRTAVLGGLTGLFDCGFVERVRAKSNIDGSGTAFDRRFSVHLSGQMAVVSESLSDNILQSQGFWPRFLFCVPEPRAGSRKLQLENTNLPDDARLLRYWLRLEELLGTPMSLDENTGGIGAEPVPLSQSAIECWINFYNDCEAKQAPLQDYCHIKAFASRAGELAARLACVFAFFEGHNEVADLDMEAACSVVRHSLSEWLRFLAAGKPGSDLVAAQEVSDWLVRACQSATGWQHFSADRWSRCGYKPYRQAKKRDAIFKLLLDKKHLFFDGASKMYSLNSALLEPPDLTDAIEVPNS